MPAETMTSPSKAAVEAAVLDLTDEQIVRALVKEDAELKRAFADREADTWPRDDHQPSLPRCDAARGGPERAAGAGPAP